MADNQKFGMILIKPDAHRDFLSEMIIRDLEAEGAQIVLRKDVAISRDQATRIYRELAGDEKLEIAAETLSGNEKNRFATLVVVKFEGDKPAQELLVELKGKADKSGIRKKYLLHSMDELREMNLGREETDHRLAENRIHVPDTYDESLEVINMLISEHDRRDLEEREPLLTKELIAEKRKHELTAELKPDGKMR